MALGNLWECVLPEGVDLPLQQIVDGTTILARQHFTSWKLEPDGEDLGAAEFACMGFPAGDMRAVVHLIKTGDRTNFYLHSAFPWLAAGAPARLTVRAIHTDHFGLEGFVEAGGDGWSVTFLDPLLALNKSKYKIGADSDFILSAVSRNVKRVDPPKRDLILAADTTARDYYLFRGGLYGLRVSTFLDNPFWVLRTAVMQMPDAELIVDIYLDRARIQADAMPAAGDMVTGTLWLQGCLADGVA